MRRDVRTPADPQDFETTMSRPPVPPRDFSVAIEGTDLVVSILEPTSTSSRPANVSYRVVYVPAALVPTGQISPRTLPALADLGDTVATVAALNDGGRQRTTISGRSTDRGFYLCCPVGQRGVVGPPLGACRTPWG